MRTTRILLRGLNFALAAVVTGSLLYVGARGAGPLPPLGNAFNPGTGVWTMATDANLPQTETLQMNGLSKPVQVSFDAHGTAYIQAKTNHDLFVTMGYLHAKFRLFQMDLLRRQGEGLLSQAVGKKALPSDEFEDKLGLERTAQAEWKDMSRRDPARIALNDYAIGVNDVIDSDKENGNLPALFKLLGYQPTRWTPIDSLVIQGDMTQTLDFSTGPLEYALLVKSLGYQKTMKWFPILPPDSQQPYDKGPYKKEPLAPIETQPMPMSTTAGTKENTTQPQVTSAEAKAVSSLVNVIDTLPARAIHHGSNSNNWAVDGTKTASGLPMLAGDPHLSQTLPAIWYQVSASSPSYHFQGVSIPGLPLILIGRNKQIAWSLTNVQNQATDYYKETTDSGHPGEYFWNGKWRRMRQVHYDIPVKGGKPVPLTVNLTVHGPVMTQSGQTMSVDWMGALPSPDIDAMLQVIKSHNYTQFKHALSKWHAPTQNFIYADKAGNIGLISAGYYPIVKSGEPWLPLPGDGSADIVGTIPYTQVPQAYDPPSHILFSANQREVTGAYPYFIGTTMNFFDNGYRADEIHSDLISHDKLTNADFAALQTDTRDYLAGEIVPKLTQALATEKLSGPGAQARKLLQTWNDKMDVQSAAASIWWTFWTQYIQDTFGPWWTADQVPTKLDSNLVLGANQVALDEDLEAWTLSSQTNPTFNLPNGTSRTAGDVMRLAFKQTVSQLSSKLGTHPSMWTWGKLHRREFPSLAQIDVLNYGPRPSGGDLWTVDAADGGMTSTAGPSWRMIVNFGGQSEAVYPGGQSENPVSPWYENQIQTWWSGQYNPLTAANAQSNPLAIWSFN